MAFGWTESSVAELRNGSVILTARALKGKLAADFPGHRRLFARSDDGGETSVGTDVGVPRQWWEQHAQGP